MDRFSQILYDLGKEIDVDLHPDDNQVCQLNYENQLRIQFQYDESKKELLTAAFICEVPPGKYREKLFREALRSNGEYPRIGTLAYSDRNNQLTLYAYTPVEGLTGEKTLVFLKSFIEKALEWKEAVEKGTPLPTFNSPEERGTMFGIKP